MQYKTLILLSELAFFASAFTRNGVSSRDIIDEVEHVMVDQFGYNDDPFVAAITPCGTYLSGNQSMGEQSTAQWVRIAFHDFVTADISTGLGGLDGSISFESDRGENAGLFVNDTINFFSPIMSAYMSISDAIVLGVAMSLAVCGGSISTPGVRVGRIDATEAGPFGVPEPTTDLETTLAQFASAGFTASDTIALTACGHSLGRVHYTTFPDIVSETAVTSDNLDGGVPFDSTPDVYDNALVTEYLDGTGSFGGPLVVAPNVTDRSDYRLYISDANATIKTLSTEENFQATCATLFEKMMNVVPSTVTLSDIITPQTWKGLDLQLDINSSGAVSVSGIIRYLYDISTTTAPDSVSYTYTSSSGNSSEFATTAIAGTGYGMYGNSTFYEFNTTTESPGTTAINFETTSYEISDDIFVVPAESTINGSVISVTGAALTSVAGTDMTATFWVPTAQSLSAAKNVVNVTCTMSETEIRGNYTMFSGTVTLSVNGGFDHVIAVVQRGDAVSDTLKTSLFTDIA